MKYDHTVTQDGQVYKPGQDVPDLGSILRLGCSGELMAYLLLELL